jgi:glycosyltransferase involved in cell wall biosynthesis
MKVLHIITDLIPAGAQTMLYRLLAATDRSNVDCRVIALCKMDVIGEKIQQLGVPVTALAMSGRFPNPLAAARLAKMIRSFNPDIIQTWMYHADLMGGLAAKWAGGIPVVWGIHHTSFEPGGGKLLTRLVMRICAATSRLIPAGIVSCSEAGRRIHVARGYDPERLKVIPNGFDIDKFRPDQQARRNFRAELNLPDDCLLIGHAGRFHPQKDHATLIKAAEKLAARLPQCRFALAGRDIVWGGNQLTSWIEMKGLKQRFFLLGLREDMPAFYAGLDLLTSSSSQGEAFPLVLGEAMACGTPCVTTDVGDSALIAGDAGRVVPPGEAEALAQAWEEVLTLPAEEKSKLGRAARKRIEEEFSLPEIASRYLDLYRQLIA